MKHDDEPTVQVTETVVGTAQTPEALDQMNRIDALYRDHKEAFDTLARACGKAGLGYIVLLGNPGETCATLSNYALSDVVRTNPTMPQDLWRVALHGWQAVPQHVADLVRQSIQKMKDAGLFPTTGGKEGDHEA